MHTGGKDVLAGFVRDIGINLWLDQLDILGGQRWDRAVEDALQTCQGMIVVLSPDAVASDNMMAEVSWALEERKTIIPIILRSCTIPFRLRRLQYMDFTADYQTGFSQLLRALHIDQPLPPQAPAVPEDTVVQGVTAPSQETLREVPTREQLPRRAEPPEPASAVPEETLETGVAASIQPPLDQASHGDGKPLDAVPQQGERIVTRIFLCHASEDKAQVREVYHRLRSIEGFEPWLDEEDLLPGQAWAREIPRALQKSDFILIFLSRGSSTPNRGAVKL